jgi:hypothetical protein
VDRPDTFVSRASSSASMSWGLPPEQAQRDRRAEAPNPRIA